MPLLPDTTPCCVNTCAGDRSRQARVGVCGLHPPSLARGNHKCVLKHRLVLCCVVRRASAWVHAGAMRPSSSMQGAQQKMPPMLHTGLDREWHSLGGWPPHSKGPARSGSIVTPAETAMPRHAGLSKRPHCMVQWCTVNALGTQQTRASHVAGVMVVSGVSQAKQHDAPSLP